MEKPKPYATQYFNLLIEWDNHNIDIDTAPQEQKLLLKDLREKAIEQSGLNLNELWLIFHCRKHRIFTKVNTYAKNLKRH